MERTWSIIHVIDSITYTPALAFLHLWQHWMDGNMRSGWMFWDGAIINRKTPASIGNPGIILATSIFAREPELRGGLHSALHRIPLRSPNRWRCSSMGGPLHIVFWGHFVRT